MRLLWIVAIAFSLHAGSAGALISLDHQDNTGGAALAVGDTFNVDIIASYDGSPPLVGLFTSSAWNPTELVLIGVTDAVALIFPGPSGSLNRIFNPVDQFNGDGFQFDPAGTIRSVQYGAPPGQLPSAGSATLITTLTFQVLSAGDGIGEIDVIANTGDQIGASGFSFSICGIGEFFCGVDRADVSLGGTTVTLATVTLVPEPGSALLLGLGLMGLGASRFRRDAPPHVGEKELELLANDLV